MDIEIPVGSVPFSAFYVCVLAVSDTTTNDRSIYTEKKEESENRQSTTDKRTGTVPGQSRSTRARPCDLSPLAHTKIPNGPTVRVKPSPECSTKLEGKLQGNAEQTTPILTAEKLIVSLPNKASQQTKWKEIPVLPTGAGFVNVRACAGAFHPFAL